MLSTSVAVNQHNDLILALKILTKAESVQKLPLLYLSKVVATSRSRG